MSEYMDIDDKILNKYLHGAYIENLTKKYKKLGYDVLTNYKINNKYLVDFYAKKNEKKLIYEIKSKKLTKRKNKELYELRNYVKEYEPNADYKLILLPRFRQKEIEFWELSMLILGSMANNGIPDELDQLSTHTTISEISDIEIISMQIERSNVIIKGNGIVSVDLVYGSDSDKRKDDGGEYHESFTFDFYITMDRSMRNIIEDEYTINTDDFYQ